MDSPPYTLTKQDMQKIGKGFLIALGGTSIAYLSDTLQVVDFGDLQPIAVVLLPVVMAVINAARLWLRDQSSL
jgi:hypothetical protein